MFANHDRCSLTFRRYYCGDLVASVEHAGFDPESQLCQLLSLSVLAFKRLVLERLGILSAPLSAPDTAVLNDILGSMASSRACWATLRFAFLADFLWSAG
jgi:hypothetical protein